MWILDGVFYLGVLGMLFASTLITYKLTESIARWVKRK